MERLRGQVCSQVVCELATATSTATTAVAQKNLIFNVISFLQSVGSDDWRGGWYDTRSGHKAVVMNQCATSARQQMPQAALEAWGWVGAGTKRIRAHTCTTVLVEVEPSLGIYSICEFTVFGCDPSQGDALLLQPDT